MKYPLPTASRQHHFLSLALAAILVAPLPSLAATTTLATSPLATSTTSTVSPNLMFMLDDSGSMDWDFMPDTAKKFAGRYGFNSSHCNGVYYNPNITYTPPVDSTGASYTPATFTAAWNSGYNTAGGTVNLDSQFPGGSGSGSSGAAAYSGPAFYYVYSGTQTTSAQMTYLNTASTFYQECYSPIGSTPGSSVFTKVRLSTVPITNLTVVSSSPPATITVSGWNRGSVTGVTVNGAQILSSGTNSSRRSSTIASYIASKINNCTAVATGNCTTSGYSATISQSNSSQVIITGPNAAAGYSAVISQGYTGMSYATTPFPYISPTSVTSIKVNGTELLLSGATASTSVTTDLASYIQAGINATGYSATVSGDVVTVTGPTSASTYTPVITTSSSGSGLSVLADSFPDTTPSKLQNFANWYSYYSNRMLMMKTGVGQAFAPIGSDYRVGFMTMNNNVNPDIVDIAPFDATQKANWYAKLYGANPGNSTPLREVLAKVGRLYAHQFGSRTDYQAVITVSGNSSTFVDSIQVNGLELLASSSAASSNSNTEAKNIAAVFIDPSDYTAVASGNKITITGPNYVNGVTPVVSDSGGGMTFSVTAFTPVTTVAGLNGITPNDPVEYSCQQNFVILSTDGYWNGNSGYQVDGVTPVGNQDGSVVRPQYDGATGTSTVTTNYSQNTYAAVTPPASYTPSCTLKMLQTQPQTFSCSVTTVSGSKGPETCTTPVNSAAPTLSGLCSSSITLPSPNPSNRVQVGNAVTSNTSVGGTSDTLADVAMYYYETDLRTAALGNCTGALGAGTDVCQNNVFKTDSDDNTAQHMDTFALGLGASGRMAFSPTYETDSSGDYNSVAKGVNADSTATPPICSWQADGTACNWPIPGSGKVENIDDLWHAAIDGRGNYFSATDPTSLAIGMRGSLASIASRKGAAAAAATSTLNPVAGNNYAYVASYTTVKWQGNLEARTINTTTGVISTTASWCVESIVSGTCAAPSNIVADSSGGSTVYNCVTSNANSSTCTAPGVFDASTNECKVPMATSCTGTMPSKVAATSDTRTIYTSDNSVPGVPALVPFDSTYAIAHPANFSAAHINSLSQWPSLTTTQQAAAEGVNLINFLRGQTGYENRAVNLGAVDNRLYRYREDTMGDALESQPLYMGPPVFSYTDKGYTDFVNAQSSRPGTVYMGTNDGMLHAFSALDEGTSPVVPGGTERWAYVPSMVIPNMWKLADESYATMHTNFVNGSPVISDVCTANCLPTDTGTAVWKTILVGGLNEGGRGYYALDVTDPTAPKLLWEFTTTAGTGSTQDDDLGYTYGNPVITAKADGTWVVLVTSGYNNVSPGNGQGYLYVLNAGTGAIISKIGTGAGTTTTPSGLAKISAWNDAPSSNRATYVYGGDLLGNVWRFDINSVASAAIGTGAVLDFATLGDASNNPQPITTAPVLGKVSGFRVIYIGTGRYLGAPDLADTQVQSEYAIKDDNATTTLTNPGGFPTRNSVKLVQQTITTGNGVRYVSNNPVDFNVDRGWYVDFPDSGERVNIDAKLVQGTLLVSTIVPSNSVCSPGGYGWLNFFDYGSGNSVNPSTGVVSVKYDHTIVGLNVLYIDGKPIVEVVTSNDPTPQKNGDVLINGTATGFTGKRVLWRVLNP